MAGQPKAKASRCPHGSPPLPGRDQDGRKTQKGTECTAGEARALHSPPDNTPRLSDQEAGVPAYRGPRQRPQWASWVGQPMQFMGAGM